MHTIGLTFIAYKMRNIEYTLQVHKMEKLCFREHPNSDLNKQSIEND